MQGDGWTLLANALADAPGSSGAAVAVSGIQSLNS